jgi:L-arabinokinase
MIVAYVSGHGYGHATRTGEVLRRVAGLEPRLKLAVATSGPERLYRQAIPGPFLFRSLECDVGLAQRDALTIDEAASAERWEAFAAGGASRIATEAAWLREVGATVVVGDIPPLAFAAAARAGVPSVGLANFSWDWIYRHLAPRHAALSRAADDAANSYALADGLLELPFAGDLSAFGRRESVGLVARRPRVSAAEARRRLGLSATRPSVLLSFGGLGLPDLDAGVLAHLGAFHFFGSELSWDVLESLDLGYQDVVAAADVVVTKPGYGIVSDAIGAGSRLVYTERGDFPEYPILVREMLDYLPAVHVSNEDLRAGRLRQPIEEVLDMPFPPAADLGGAERAARRLIELAK